ncbi:MAG TPA: DUF6236 family protein [Brumimicrobium sp.]|nr:DUF6236 family protein [Brumimicrobium sp.]
MKYLNNRAVVVKADSYLTKGGTSLKTDVGISDESLRKYLMYWDEIHYVDSSFFSPLDLNLPEYKLLAEEEIFKSIIIDFKHKGSLDPFTIAASKELAQIEYYNQINTSNNKMLFSIAQSGNILSLMNQNPIKVDTLELSIADFLPIPTNCSIEEILTFKEKRKDELLAFRVRLNEFTKSINKENFTKEELVHLEEKIILSLSDIHRVMDESGFQKVLQTMKTYFNISDSNIVNAVLPALGEIAGQNLQIPNGAGVLSGLALNSFIKLGMKKQSKLAGLPKETQDFAYLYYAEKLDKN